MIEFNMIKLFSFNEGSGVSLKAKNFYIYILYVSEIAL